MQRRLIIAGALVCLLLILACGSSPSSSQPSGSAPAVSGPGKVGDRVEAGGAALTVVKVDKMGQISDFQKAGDSKQFVVTEVLIEAVGDKTPYNPLYFKVKDGTGVEYNAAISTADNSLKSGELAKGDKARGTVAFEVPKDVKGLVLSYQPITFGAAAPIRVALD